MQNNLNSSGDTSSSWWKKWFEEHPITVPYPYTEPLPTISVTSTQRELSPSEVVAENLAKYRNGLISEDLEDIFWMVFHTAVDLMKEKNHDYGDSWRKDRRESITDTIRHKLDRVYNLEELQRKGESPRVAEGIISELLDAINYCCFRIIKEELD